MLTLVEYCFSLSGKQLMGIWGQMLSLGKLHICICIIVSMPVPRYLNAFGLRTENLTRERKKRQIRCRLPLWQFRVWNSTLKDKSELWKTWNLCVCVCVCVIVFISESKRTQPKLESFRYFKSEWSFQDKVQERERRVCLYVDVPSWRTEWVGSSGPLPFTIGGRHSPWDHGLQQRLGGYASLAYISCL